jgi:predicted RecB family endonuclease
MAAPALVGDKLNHEVQVAVDDLVEDLVMVSDFPREDVVDALSHALVQAIRELPSEVRGASLAHARLVLEIG